MRIRSPGIWRGQTPRPLIFLAALLVGWATAMASSAPRILRASNPVYPTELAARGIEGTVVLNALVSEEGRVTDVKVETSPHDALSAAALTAVLGWQFEPARKDGVAIARRVRLPVRFSIPVPEYLRAVAGREVFVEPTGRVYERRDLRVALGGVEPMQAAMRPLKWMPPEYPESLVDEGVRGRVFVEFIVDETGHVIQPRVTRSDHPKLDLLALRAIVQSRWNPILVDGQAVNVLWDLPLRFPPGERD